MSYIYATTSHEEGRGHCPSDADCGADPAVFKTDHAILIIDQAILILHLPGVMASPITPGITRIR